METFEIILKEESFKITFNSAENSFSVFNHTTFHTIWKNDFGIWRSKEHRFGIENIPVDDIGDAIDKHYLLLQHVAASVG